MKWFHKNPNKKDSNEGKIPIKATIIVFFKRKLCSKYIYIWILSNLLFYQLSSINAQYKLPVICTGKFTSQYHWNFILGKLTPQKAAESTNMDARVSSISIW